MNNGPFAGSGHMVRNKLHWDANDAVGLPKQRNSYQSSPTFLCFGSPTASFASQCNLFRTMWPDPAKGLFALQFLWNVDVKKAINDRIHRKIGDVDNRDSCFKASEGIEVGQKMVAKVISTELGNIKTVRVSITRSVPLFCPGWFDLVWYCLRL